MNTKKFGSLLVASAVMFGAGIGTAFAGGQGTLPNSYFTELPGVIAKPATGGAVGTAPRASIGAYAAPHSHGVQVLPFDPNHG
jgi:hypothetical protein